MDLLFKRYASPFLLLEIYIEEGRLYDFVAEFMRTHNEELMWDVWLHKVFDKNFEEYKEAVLSAAKSSIRPSKKQLETTLIDSMNILDSFNPEE